MTKSQAKRLILLSVPYVLLGLICTNLGEAWRLGASAAAPSRLLGFMACIGPAFSNPLPSLHPLDICVGIISGSLLRLAVYLRGKNAKQYRHGREYGSARWGTANDIAPFIDPEFENKMSAAR